MSERATTSVRKGILVALAIGVGALGTWVHGVLPDGSDVLPQPFVRDGGSDIAIASISTSKAPNISTISPSGTLPATHGEYLTVELDITDVPKPTVYRGFILDSDGTTYYQLADGTSRCGLHQPGMSAPCRFVFEVSEDGLADPVLWMVSAPQDLYAGEVIELELPDE